MSSDDRDPEATPPDPATVRPRRRGAVAGLMVVLIPAAIAGAIVFDLFTPSDTERALAAFTPSADQPDPSMAIPGLVAKAFAGGEHVADLDGVAYDSRPPSGGPHGLGRAACSGVAYRQPVPDPDAVHSLEHGAVWITYDPARTPASTIGALTARISGDRYLMLSPYPGLDSPLSLQAWGHRLTLDAPEDIRFEQFVQALRNSPYNPPEPGGDCGPPSIR